MKEAANRGGLDMLFRVHVMLVALLMGTGRLSWLSLVAEYCSGIAVETVGRPANHSAMSSECRRAGPNWLRGAQHGSYDYEADPANSPHFHHLPTGGLFLQS